MRTDPRATRAKGLKPPASLWPSSVLLLTLLTMTHVHTAEPDATPPGSDAAVAGDPQVSWRSSLAEGFAAAQSGRAPVIVLAGADWCAFCREQKEILADEQVQTILRHWIPVAIDVDTAANDAESLAIGSIPAFRLLTPVGQLIASHDGLMQASELVDWLQTHFDDATVVIADELLAEGPPDANAVARLLKEFQHRDPVMRHAAIRRLSPYPDAAAHQVVQMFPDAPLASRLTALDLLAEWKAPIDGLDPWQPESITDDRLASLTVWARDVDPAAARAAEDERPLTPEERAEVERTFRLLIAADPAEAAALREQLARFGRRLLPTVYAALTDEESDVARVQLTALRYRLVAAPELVLRWPGGLERLADFDLPTRIAAVDELAKRATRADEPLLLELFSDQAPLVREISLRALQQVGGGGASSALIRLLDDPDPNVRAAVLNQLGEKPAQSVVSSIAKYVEKEQDPDLVVHAVRLLRGASGPAALDTLKSLLEHDSWRVRAEAAEAVGKAANSQFDDAEKANSYIALLGLLDDEDSFVVSRAVEALIGADLVTAVDPLVAAADKHPDIAPSVVLALSQGKQQRAKASPHIRRFCTHESAAVRAAAITGLCRVVAGGAAVEFQAAVADADPTVRIAAADALFTMTVELLNSRLDNRNVATRSFIKQGGVESIPDVGAGLLGSAEDDRDATPGSDDALDHPDAVTTDSDSVPPPPPLSESAVRRREAATAELAPAAIESHATAPADHILLQFRDGKSPAWIWEFAAGLKPLLSAQSADEQLAAARPLAILAIDASLPILQTSAVETALRNRVSEVIPYILWNERIDLFRRIVSVARSEEALGQAANSLASTPDERAAAELWELLARDGMHAGLTNVLLHALRATYLGNAYSSRDQISESNRERTVAETTSILAAGRHWQCTAALLLRFRVDLEAAAESARAILADAAADAALRSDAFAILLAADQSDSTAQAAVEGLSSADSQICRLSLTALTYGVQSIIVLPSGVTFEEHSYSGSYNRSTAQPGLPEPPEGLTVDAVRPLLVGDDREAVAQAGYLLVLLGEPDGFAPLFGYWQAAGQANAALTRLVYRAIALQDDSAQMPTLEGIYSHLQPNSGEGNVRDFYWSIRGMTDPRATALRKRIRDEVGMDSLR